MYEHIKLSVQNSIATITIDRPASNTVTQMTR